MSKRINKGMRKTVCFFLMACMLMNLLACSGAKKENIGEKIERNTKFSETYKECPMDLSLLEEEGWENTIYDVKKQNDRYYILALRKHEEEQKLILFSIDKDGVSPEVVELESSSTKVVYYCAVTIGSDETVYVLKKVNEGNRVAETVAESWDIPKHYVLAMIDFTGTVKEEADITDQTDDDGWKQGSTLLADHTGPMLLFVSEGAVRALRVSKDGKVSDIVNVEGGIGQLNRFFISNMDQLCQLQVDAEKMTWHIAFFNEKFQLEVRKDLPSGFSYSMDTGAKFEMLGENQLIIANDQTAMEYTWEAQRAQELLDLSVIGSSVKEWKGFFSDEAGKLYGVYINNEDALEFSRFEERDQAEIIRVAWLPMHGEYQKSLFKEKVMEFNKTHKDCQIVLDTYGLLMSEPDYENPDFDNGKYIQELYTSYNEAITKINADIAAGNSPDVFCCDDFEWGPYIKKGMLADIGELMAQDEEISKLDYLDNVLEACKVDGKLYMAIPSFSIYTMLGKQSIVGDGTHWTLDEMMEVIRSKEGVVSPFGVSLDGTRFLEYCYMFNMDHYVDKAAGKSYFDAEEFKNMMEFAKNIQPPDFEQNLFESASIYDRYKNDEYLFSMESFYNLGFSTGTWYTVFQEPVGYVGFPTSGECGSLIKPLDTLVINEKSPHKQEAWLFVREFLMEGWQKLDTNKLPTLKKVFDKLAEETYKEIGLGRYSIGLGGFLNPDDNVKVVQQPREEWDRFLEFLQSVNFSSVENDSQIIKIIEEEAPAYINGFRGLDETATIIQNRVTLYLQENK